MILPWLVFGVCMLIGLAMALGLMVPFAELWEDALIARYRYMGKEPPKLVRNSGIITTVATVVIAALFLDCTASLTLPLAVGIFSPLVLYGWYAYRASALKKRRN